MAVSVKRRALAISQPTADRHIEQMKAAVGAALFTRSRAGMTPKALARSLRPETRATGRAAGDLARAA